MKAVCWMGKKNMQVHEVPDPRLLSQKDAIVKISSAAICGSDLHLYDGVIPSMKEYDIMGHEFMGEIVEVGSDIKNLKVGDRVIIPFPISCGGCHYCKTGFTSACDNTNPNAGQQEETYTTPGAALYGYSHLYGGYDGRTSRVCASSFCRFQRLQSSGRNPRREAAFPNRRLSHRLSGGGSGRTSKMETWWRFGGGGTRWSVCRRQRASSWCGGGHHH